MKRKYSRPSMTVAQIENRQAILQGSPGSGVYTDDPQLPGAALSRQRGGWDDLWDGEGE